MRNSIHRHGALLLAIVLFVTCCFGTLTAVAEGNKDIPVTYYTRTNNNKETAPDNDKVLAEIEARSGIKLNVVAISNEAYGERLGMMMGGGEKFEGFNLVGAAGCDLMSLIERGSIIPLNDLIEAYGPNIQKWMAPAFEFLGTDANGNIWDLPRSENFPMGFVPTIRQDWLDKLGMDMPTTLPELEAFFDAVLANDLNGNGDPNDEIPYLGDGFLYGMSNFSCYFFGNGMTNIDAERRYIDADGIVHPVFDHPNFKLMLETFARWYQKGYMHPEANILTTTQRGDLRVADRVAVTAGWYSTGVNAELTLRENGVDALYVALPPMKDFPEGGAEAWPSNPLFDHQTVVMSTAENAEGLVKYYDWMLASPENLALAAYGIEGVHWNWHDKEANVIELTPESGNYAGYYTLGNLYYFPQMPTLYISPDSARDYEYRVLQDTIRNNYNVMASFDAGITYSYSGTDAEFLTNDGFTMVEEAITKIVLGQMDINEWDKVHETYMAIEGDVYSQVWTDQYHAARGE